MIKRVVFEWVKQYLPILVNSICTAICLALAGCKLTAADLVVEIESPVSYHSSSNSIPR